MTKRKPRPQTMSDLARRGAAARDRKLWLNDPNRPQPSLAPVAWLNRPDPWADLEKETAGKPLQSPSRQQV